MDCKVIVNCESGNCKKLDLRALMKYLGYPFAQIQYINSKSNWSCDDAETIVVCGGDGTLHNALQKCQNKKLFYLPCGTLNESRFVGNTIDCIGKVNDLPFGYVCATGSFTQIGYLAKNKNKQKFKAFAYLPQVLKNYSCHNIPAQIDVDRQTFSNNYTLLMVLKSCRCFGFDFNRQYKLNPTTYLLAVNSFGKNNLWNKTRMFFTFFDIFFRGVDKPTINKHYLLVPFEKATVTLEKPQDFCIDGEKYTLGGKLIFEKQKLKYPIEIIQLPKK